MKFLFIFSIALTFHTFSFAKCLKSDLHSLQDENDARVGLLNEENSSILVTEGQKLRRLATDMEVICDNSINDDNIPACPVQGHFEKQLRGEVEHIYIDIENLATGKVAKFDKSYLFFGSLKDRPATHRSSIICGSPIYSAGGD